MQNKLHLITAYKTGGDLIHSTKESIFKRFKWNILLQLIIHTKSYLFNQISFQFKQPCNLVLKCALVCKITHDNKLTLLKKLIGIKGFLLSKQSYFPLITGQCHVRFNDLRFLAMLDNSNLSWLYVFLPSAFYIGRLN